MKRQILIAGAITSLVIIGAFALTDSRIKAENALLRKAAAERAMSTGQQVQWSLEMVQKATARNAAASAAFRALQSEYAKAPQTFEGIQAFKVVLAKAKPQIMRPLIELSRSKAATQFFELTNSVDSHADSLMALQNSEENASGGLLTKLQRTLSPVESP